MIIASRVSLMVSVGAAIYTTLFFPASNASADPPKSYEHWIARLDDDSYHVRQSAEQHLLRLPADDRLIPLLTAAAINHQSLEVRRRAISIIRRFQLAAYDDQIQQLADLRCDPTRIELPGWQRFASMAGTDHAARQFFAVMSSRYGQMLRRIDQQRRNPPDVDAKSPHEPKAMSRLPDQLDPYRIPNNDAALWAMVLMFDRVAPNQAIADRSHRVLTALSHSALGPRLQSREQADASPHDAIVIKRMISYWLSNHETIGTRREQLIAAMRFRCYDRANAICDRVFADSDATPSAQVTALLASSALERHDLETQLRNRIEDQRTSHVWQLVANRHTKIRTQICDVAIAILLHEQGIDPREVGFAELQADPVLIFRDHSLGFPDNAARQSAHTRAMTRISG